MTDTTTAQCPNCGSFAWYIFETMEHGTIGAARCEDCGETFEVVLETAPADQDDDEWTD